MVIKKVTVVLTILNLDATIRLLTAQVQEVPGLAEAVGGVRYIHAVLLQVLAG